VQAIKEDGIWFFGSMGELISHTSIVAIDNMQTYEADNPFLASLFDLSAVIDVDPFGNQDLKMLPGIMLECKFRLSSCSL
jgi:hypothetical protein